MQVVQSLRVGGLERVVVNLVNNASSEFRFVVCCLEDAGAWAHHIDSTRGKVVALGKHPGLGWHMPFQIAKLARTERIQVVHTHNATAHLYGALGARFAGAKVLHTEHHPKLGGEEARINRLNRLAAPFTNFTVGVSKKLAEIAVQHEGAKPARLAVIPNGIPVEEYARPVDRQVFRQQLGLSPAARLIGSVGRLVEQKNYALLLRAFRPVAASDPDSYLVILGDGPLRQSLVELANELQIAKRVFFPGFRNDVPQLLSSFDAFVLSSHNEGLPVALLEAMAAGCPIIVTAVPGNVEVIEHDVTGLIVKPDDPTGLSAAITQLLADPNRARRLGAVAQAVARERYSVQGMVRQYETLWRQLAA